MIKKYKLFENNSFSIGDIVYSKKLTYGMHGYWIFPNKKYEIINIIDHNKLVGRKLIKLREIERNITFESFFPSEYFMSETEYNINNFNL